ncbi:hypothetical protein H0H92_005044 [Tricholoma furcatifolium]|nr:hypothetical protein H0H92_005044 [Tricholoma furcatifolium]
MEIFNRLPTIAEDTLHYTLYLPKDLSDKASATTFAACITTYVETILSDFIWHRDAFELKVVEDPDPDNTAWILDGRMRVGDCVDDEWCSVWLLRQVSAKWDVVISVFDSDGEFLLIEAAEALPSWVKPTNSENRVWIYNSRLHLIPLSHISPPSRKRFRRQRPGVSEDEDRDHSNIEFDDEYICTQDAINVVRDPSILTFAPSAVEGIVWRRISGYPNAVREHVHNTKAYLPTDIALSLLKSPSLIQKAVEAFYTRDAIQLRAAHRMNRFPPSESVLTTVKMTRTAYAQLLGQKFFPPKIFGRWAEPEGTKEWRWRDVGMKIAVGFEMLYHESKSRTNTISEVTKSSIEAKKEALRRNPDYIKYIQNLRSTDYFRGELEGSELWCSLEGKAASMFVEVRKEDDVTRPSFATRVQVALSDHPEVSTIPQIDEDPDDWLNVDSESFEAMLEQSMGGKSKSTVQADDMDVDNFKNGGTTEDDLLASAQAAKLKDLAQKVENFVEGEGDIEGAMFDDEVLSDEEFSEEESGDDDNDEENTPMEPSARRAAMEQLVPGLDPSEYGKMPPSFHNNSQRVAPTIVDGTEEDILGSEESQSSHKEAPFKRVREPIIPRDKFDGVDSDDETDEDEVMDDESDEDRPQVVGEVEIDMEEEEEEFLEFSRQALGISDDQWNDIIQDRRERGESSAFLPESAKKTASSKKTATNTSTASQDKQTHGRPPVPGPRPNVNPNLDSFEAVMQAMDAELSRLRSSKGSDAPRPTTAEKGKGKAKVVVEDEDEGIEQAMDAELKAALEGEDEDEEEEELPDYNLIKNFLESFKSQAGLSGPVSNLAGMLQPGWKLPHDAP